MANRREEERERLREARREREAEQAKAGRNRLLIAYIAAGAVGLIVVGAIVFLVTSSGSSSGNAHIEQSSGSTNGVSPDERKGTAPAAVKVANLQQAARKAGCVLRLKLPEEGHAHLPPSAKTPHYKTNPPTSGNHVEPPYQQADGAYSEMPKEIDIVHSLEHGRLEIQYFPQLPEKEQLELKGLYDTLYGGSLLFPNTNMHYAVAATTWTNLLGCKSYRGAITMDAIRDFGKVTWAHAREPAAPFGILGPTPREPEEG